MKNRIIKTIFNTVEVLKETNNKVYDKTKEILDNLNIRFDNSSELTERVNNINNLCFNIVKGLNVLEGFKDFFQKNIMFHIYKLNAKIVYSKYKKRINEEIQDFLKNATTEDYDDVNIPRLDFKDFSNTRLLNDFLREHYNKYPKSILLSTEDDKTFILDLLYISDEPVLGKEYVNLSNKEATFYVYSKRIGDLTVFNNPDYKHPYLG